MQSASRYIYGVTTVYGHLTPDPGDERSPARAPGAPSSGTIEIRDAVSTVGTYYSGLTEQQYLSNPDLLLKRGYFSVKAKIHMRYWNPDDPNSKNGWVDQGQVNDEPYNVYFSSTYGPHLHFEVRYDRTGNDPPKAGSPGNQGVAVDPEGWINRSITWHQGQPNRVEVLTP